MSIEVTTTDAPITVSASGTQVNATVSGGVGPQGPQGPSGVGTWSLIVGKPATFPPSAHTHAQADVGSSLGNEDLAGDLQEILTTTANASNLSAGTLDAARLPGSVVLTTDSRLSDSREWSASTVTQAEAEAGTATTRRAWTAQRVFQAITAWWSASGIQATIDGKAADIHAANHTLAGTDPLTIAASQVLSELDNDNLAQDISGLQSQIDGKASSTHASTHAAAGSDPLSLSPSQVGPTLGGSADIGADISTLAGLVTNCAAAVHTHAASDIVSGTISTARLPVATNAQQGIVRINTAPSGGLVISSGLLSVSSSVVFTTDSRLTNARNPLSHATSHDFTGTDPVFIDAVQVATNTLTIQGATYSSLNLALQIIDTAVTGKASKQLTTDALAGTTANRIVVTGTGGAVTTATIGSGLTLSGGTLTASGGGGGSSVGSDLYLWSVFR